MRTKWRVTTTAAVMVSGLMALTWAAPAAAQITPVQKEAARQNYKEAEIRLKAGNYAAALELYRLADQIAPNPAPKYKIALCRDRLGQIPEAVAAYQTFLDSNPPPEKLGEQIADAHQRLDALRRSITKPAPLPVVVPPPVVVAPPVVVVQPGVVARPVVIAQPPQGEIVYRRRRSNAPAYVFFGLAGVGVGVTAAFGALALQAKSSFNSNPTLSGANKEQLDARVSDSALGAAIVFGVAGGVWMLSTPARPELVGGIQGFYPPYAGPGAAGAVGGFKF
jgi:tetratricopeptide (TPR) repeat protein